MSKMEQTENDINDILSQGEDVDVSRINSSYKEMNNNISRHVSRNHVKSISYDDYDEDESVNELEPGLKILRETDKSYYVEDADGRKFWMCKECYKQGKKKIFTSPLQIAGHYKKEHKVISEDLDEDLEDESEDEHDDSEYVPSTEELLTSEKAKKLKRLLLKAPGIKNTEKKKIDWVCYVFQENKKLNTNPEALHRYLKSQFPRMSDEDIAFIVKTVFQTFESESMYSYDDYEDLNNESTSSDNETTRYDDLNRHNYYSYPGMGFGMHTYPQPFLIRSVDDLIKLFNFFEKRTKPERTYSEDEIEKRVKEKVELELMKRQLEEMKEMIKQQQEIMKNLTSGDFIEKIVKRQGEWNEYKLAAEILDKVDRAASGVAKELAKTNRLILMLTLGKKKGMTTDELFDLIKQEFPDYVEE